MVDATRMPSFAATRSYSDSKDRRGPGRLEDTWIWRNGNWADVSPRPVVPDVPEAGSAEITNATSIVAPLPAPDPVGGCPVVHCDAEKARPYPSPSRWQAWRARWPSSV